MNKLQRMLEYVRSRIVMKDNTPKPVDPHHEKMKQERLLKDT